MLDITAYGSLVIQFITGAIDVLGLSIDVPSDKMIFKDLLKVELLVQCTEFIFYIWMIRHLYSIKNITPYRYMDWFLTTPTMLITFMAYLDDAHYKGLYDYISNNISLIVKVVLLNMAMLLFGLLGELKYIPYTIGIALGFIPFMYYFYIIYDTYINKKEAPKTDKKRLYWFFLIVWAIYGVVAFAPYVLKNTLYNILDVVAKNGFGVFLVYVLWTNRIK